MVTKNPGNEYITLHKQVEKTSDSFIYTKTSLNVGWLYF